MGISKLSREKYIRMNQILFSITNSYESRLAREIKQNDISLSISEKGIIMVLGQLQPINSRTLSRIMDINPGTISSYIEQLVQKGLVKRIRDEQDRRQWMLHLSREGIKEYDETCDGSVEYTSSIMEILSRQEQECLHELLNKISRFNRYGW